MKKRYMALAQRFAFIFIGGLISAVGLSLFYIPNHFVSGGLSGFALIMEYLLGTPSWLMIPLLNLPFIALGFIFLDYRYVIGNAVGLLGLSFGMWIIPLFVAPPTHDPVLAACIGGALSGAGLGFCFRYRGGQAGFDFLSQTLKQKLGIEMSSTMVIYNTMIVLGTTIFMNIELALYTILAIFISGSFVSTSLVGFHRRQTVWILSKEWELINDYILNTLHRGSTLTNQQGGLTGNEYKTITTIITTRELAKLREYIVKTDPDAFFSVSSTSEVVGNWVKPHKGGFSRYEDL